MTFDHSTKILIVGLGLMGGSYAQALTSAGYEVGALSLQEEDVEYALQKGMIRHGKTQVDAAYVGQFDLVVFALYPNVLLSWLKQNQHLLKAGALLTDVTGVKSKIVYEIESFLRPDVEFIGAHPMAGRETSGIESASKEIFQDANYIITPTEKSSPHAIEICRRLGEALGFSNINLLSPEEHDEMIGFLSQLTHCIAVSLMVCKESRHLVDYTGNSFRDLTRIARINEEMWSELFLLNQETLLEQMDLFHEKFLYLRECIAQKNVDGMKEMMRISTQRRQYFDDKERS